MPQQCTCFLHVTATSAALTSCGQGRSRFYCPSPSKGVGEAGLGRAEHEDSLGFVCLDQQHMEVLCFVANTGQAHCILLFCMRPPRAPLCFHHFCNPAWPPLSCMQSQTPLHCPFMMMACVFHPLFPQVYAALSILIPGAQCTSCHDCSLLFEFIFSLSCQEILCPLLPSSSSQGCFHPAI